MLIHKIVEPDEGSFCCNCVRALKYVSDGYEAAHTRVSLDPDEAKEYENGNKPKPDDKGVSTYFGLL